MGRYQRKTKYLTIAEWKVDVGVGLILSSLGQKQKRKCFLSH